MERVNVMRAKGLIFEAMGNVLHIIGTRIAACDGNNEDADDVIGAAEVILRHLNTAMGLILDDGHCRSTITDPAALTTALNLAVEFARLMRDKVDAHDHGLALLADTVKSHVTVARDAYVAAIEAGYCEAGG